ncbi:immunoglobulin-like domain-containing protein [Thermococcus sp.]
MRSRSAVLVLFTVILILSALAHLRLKNPEIVSPGALSIAMVLDNSTYHPGETLTLTIVNNGSERLIAGAFYRLYRLENGRWKEIPTGFSFTGIGYGIEPGQSWSQAVPLRVERNGKLEPLEPGRYRIEKTVMIDRGRSSRRIEEITLSAEFEVVGRPEPE